MAVDPDVWGLEQYRGEATEELDDGGRRGEDRRELGLLPGLPIPSSRGDLAVLPQLWFRLRMPQSSAPPSS